MNESTRQQQLALLGIAFAITVSLTWIALTAIKLGNVDANGATLVGVIVGALGASVKDIISAVRGYSMSAQLGKVTDQLAASGPVVADKADDSPTGTPDDPVSVIPGEKP